MLRTNNSRRDGDFASRRMPRTKGEYDRLRCADLSDRCIRSDKTLHDFIADLSLHEITDDLERMRRENERLRRELAVRQFQAGDRSGFARECVHAIGNIIALSQRI